MSRVVVDHVVAPAARAYGFLRGLVALVGFNQTSILCDHDARAAGNSKYNKFIWSMYIGLNAASCRSAAYPLHG